MDNRLRALERAYIQGDPSSGILLLYERLRLGETIGDTNINRLASAIYHHPHHSLADEITMVGEPWDDPTINVTIRAGWGESTQGYAQWSGGWIGQLNSGKWFVGHGWCDTTGWACQSGLNFEIFDSLDEAILALDHDDIRRILGAPNPE